MHMFPSICASHAQGTLLVTFDCGQVEAQALETQNKLAAETHGLEEQIELKAAETHGLEEQRNLVAALEQPNLAGNQNKEEFAVGIINKQDKFVDDQELEQVHEVVATDLAKWKPTKRAAKNQNEELTIDTVVEQGILAVGDHDLVEVKEPVATQVAKWKPTNKVATTQNVEELAADTVDEQAKLVNGDHNLEQNVEELTAELVGDHNWEQGKEPADAQVAKWKPTKKVAKKRKVHDANMHLKCSMLC